MPYKNQNLKLSLVEKEILVILVEAGEENLPTVLNTLSCKLSHYSKDELIRVARKSIQNLLQMDFVFFSKDFKEPHLRWTPISSEEVKVALSLNEVIIWDEDNQSWKWNENEFGPFRFTLVLTENGEKALES